MEIITAGYGLNMLIACAATMTGLPGVAAGIKAVNGPIVLGVRMSKSPQGDYNENGSASLSAMPSGVPLAYCGYNEKGFLHPCMLAETILRRSK